MSFPALANVPGSNSNHSDPAHVTQLCHAPNEMAQSSLGRCVQRQHGRRFERNNTGLVDDDAGLARLSQASESNSGQPDGVHEVDGEQFVVRFLIPFIPETGRRGLVDAGSRDYNVGDPAKVARENIEQSL